MVSNTTQCGLGAENHRLISGASYLLLSPVVAISNTYEVVKFFIGSAKSDGKWL